LDGGMTATPYRTSARPITLGLAILALLFTLVFARLVASGTLDRDIKIVLILFMPVAFYFSFVRPLVFPYGLYILLVPFDTLLGVSGGTTVTKLLGVATGLLLIFYCLRTRQLARPNRALWIVTALIGWMIVSLLWAVNPASSGTWLQTYLGLALLYAALSVTPITLSEFRFILGAIVAASTIAAILGIVDFHSVSPHAANLGANRVVLTTGQAKIDPNQYADALVLPLAIVTIAALTTRWASLQLLAFCAAAAMVVAIVVSGSREAVVGVVVVFAYYLWRSKYRTRLLLPMILVAVAAVPFAATLLIRFQNSVSSGGAERTSIWAVGLEAVKHYALFGSGIGTFSIVYDRFYLAVPQSNTFGWSAPPHNVALQFLVELGIIGLGLLMWFVVANFTMLRTIDSDHPLYDYRLMVEAGLIAVCVSAFFIGSFNDKWVWLAFATAAQLTYLASTYRRLPKSAAPTWE
jgi:O-antigen ligase